MPLGQITEALLALYPDVNMTDKLADVSAMLRIEIDREEDGRWIGKVPELPGVLAYGATEAEARSKVTALAFRVIAERMPKLLMAKGLECL